MRHAVCAILMRGQGGNQEILLGRRSVHRRSYAGYWDLPGGHVEAGESGADALVREMREELGIRPTSFHFLTTVSEEDPTLQDQPRYDLFLITCWTGTPSLCNGEHDELRWTSPAAAALLPRLALHAYPAIFGALV